MSRQVFLNLYPYHSAQQLTLQKTYEIVTSSCLAAQTLGVRHNSLRDDGVKQLKHRGIEIASALTTYKLFRQTVTEVLAPNDPVGTARTLLPTVRMLLQSAASLELIPNGISERTERILRLVPKYQSKLRESGLVDESELYWRTIEGGIKRRKVLLYGYFQLRPDELELIDAISGDESVLFLPTLAHEQFQQNRAAITFLESRGWQIEGTQPDPIAVGEHLYQSFLQPHNASSALVLPQPDNCAVYAYGNLESEARGTLAQIKQLLHRAVKAKDIVIIARNEAEYGAVLLDIAWEYDIPLRALYDTPLSSTRLGAWLNLLLEVINNRFPFESTAKLLSHPLCTNPDAEFWSEVRAKKPANLAEWTKFSQEQINIDFSVLNHKTRFRRDNWVEWVRTIFQTFNLRRRCARWSRESVAFNTLDSALVEFAKPEHEILTWDEFTQEFQDTIDLLSVPAQPGRGGVELHGPHATIGTRYRHVFVLGMAEGVFPPPVQNDPVLDFYERKQLSQVGIVLASAADAARQEALGFGNLLQSLTNRVVFSYAKLNGRQEQTISPYLKRLNLIETSLPALPLASQEEMRKCYVRLDSDLEDPVLAQATHAWRVEQSREDATPQDEYDGIIGIPVSYTDRHFSVSQLTSLGLCPFKWFAAKVLKLGELDEAEVELSPSRRGNLYHKTIELLFEAVQVHPEQLLTEPELLRSTFLAAEIAIDLPKLPAWDVCRTEHIRTLSLTIQEPSFFPAGAEAISLEGAFEGDWQGFKIRGRVDRIDRTESGLVLIDYKTGSSVPKGVSDEAGNARLDLQLPIYKAVAAANLFPNEPVADAYYYSLSKGKKLAVSKNSVATEDDLSAFADRCKGHLDRGRFPVKPDNKKVACEYCAFDPVCRQGSRLSRKERNNELN
jgi:RecB family exonuclease